MAALLGRPIYDPDPEEKPGGMRSPNWLPRSVSEPPVEVHHTGDPELRAEVRAIIEHVLSDRTGDWRVSIVGSQWAAVTIADADEEESGLGHLRFPRPT